MECFKKLAALVNLAKITNSNLLDKFILLPELEQ